MSLEEDYRNGAKINTTFLFFASGGLKTSTLFFPRYAINLN